jgi:hypothetical protein
VLVLPREAMGLLARPRHCVRLNGPDRYLSSRASVLASSSCALHVANGHNCQENEHGILSKTCLWEVARTTSCIAHSSHPDAITGTQQAKLGLRMHAACRARLQRRPIYRNTRRANPLARGQACRMLPLPLKNCACADTITRQFFTS